jgi:ribosomal protein L7Ae-like RNA K-turn-binding protein
VDEFINNVPRQNLIIGYRQVARGLTDSHLRCVVIASDIDIEIKDKLIRMCQDKNVHYVFGNTKIEMGKLLDLDVACGVCAQIDIAE